MGQPLVDLTQLDLSKNVVTEEDLRSTLPHRGTFQLIDGICYLDRERGYAVGYKDWPADPWWGKDHVPGKPLMPGVLMIEGAAQIGTFLIKKTAGWSVDSFVGLTGVNDARIRGQVVPPARVYFVTGNIKVSGRRMARMPAQVFCNGQLVMELELLGVML